MKRRLRGRRRVLPLSCAPIRRERRAPVRRRDCLRGRAAAARVGVGYTVLARRTDSGASSRGPCPSRPASRWSRSSSRCTASEWTLPANLSSFCQQHYPGPVQFPVRRARLGRPCLANGGRTTKVCIPMRTTSPSVADMRLYGPNRKISNILNMLPQARHDVLVFADSDVSVGPDYLRNVIGELRETGCRSRHLCVSRASPIPVLAAPVGRATNYHFLPGVVTGLALRSRAALLRAKHRNAARHARKNRRAHTVRQASGRKITRSVKRCG